LVPFSVRVKDKFSEKKVIAGFRDAN